MPPFPTHPPSAPTYESLRSGCLSHTILLRVHDTTSHSPLVWTNDTSTSGFHCPNARLHLSPTAYAGMAEEIKLAGGRGQWAEGAWMKDTMVDHVLLRWPGRPSRSTGGELESSPWVSACGNLDWAIWEIAKRLSQGLPSVRLAIIRQEHHDFDPDRLDGAHARIRTHKIASDGAPQPASAAMSGRIRQLTVAPAVVLDRHIPRIISTRKQEVYSSAAARAREAHEVLVYGRIFSESILADLTCTRNVSDLHTLYCTCTRT